VRLRQIFAGLAIHLSGALVLWTGAAILPVADGPAFAQNIITAGFRPIAPYVMQNPDGSLTGLEYDLVMAAAQRGGLALKAELAPFGRLPEDFRRQIVGAMVPANPAMGLPGCLSDTVLVYRNLVYTLAQRGLVLQEPADLVNLDVMAFQNAQVILGPAMVAVRQGNPKYREVANQMLQVRALFSGRTDAIIAERRIFLNLTRGSDVGLDTSAAVTEHDLFPPISYGVAFHDPAQCAAFNHGLEMLKRGGDYDAILNRWEGPLQAQNNSQNNRAARPPG